MRARRCAALVLCATLLAGCSGGDDAGDDAATTSSTTAADGTTLPGTRLGLGDPAVVRFAPDRKHESTIRLVVRDVEKGEVRDLREFSLNDAARSSNVVYVDLSIENVGGGDVGGEFVTVFGKASKSLVVRPVTFGSRFGRCDYRPLPEKFGKGDRVRTCVVLLAPDHGRISDIEWRFPDDQQPISWAADADG
jgi:hypothetical protein